jgi:cytidine deaminase
MDKKEALGQADELVSMAWDARTRAYVPYSGFGVGAALLCANGRIFTGCNVENLSFGLTICAERAAVTAAITAGERLFTRIAIVADSREPISPCGACRQVLAEFAPTLAICSTNLQGEIFISDLGQLLPRAATGILNRPSCST